MTHRCRLADLPCAGALALIVLFLNTASLQASETQTAPSATIVSPFTACEIGNDAASMSAECATLSLPLNPASQSDSRIEIHIARLAALTNAPKPDPFTLIAGGPGQSAAETYPSVAYAFRHIRRERDVYLIDQRGTGKSSRLDCPANKQSNDLEFDADVVTELSAKCFAHQQLDTRMFTTSVAVRDLEQIRATFGIEQWNLYGVSYGTRVATHYAKRFPSRVRTMLLDAVVPPDVSLGPDIALTAQAALDRLFTRCNSNSGCKQAFPDLQSQTSKLLDELSQKPRKVTFEDVTTGRVLTIDFTDKHLAVTLRLMSYTAHGNAILPSMLNDAIVNGNFAPLARQAELQIQSLGDSLAGGMHSAVICTEDEPFIPKDFNNDTLATTYLGTELLDAMKASCAPWDAGVIDDDFKSPLVSNIPTLLMSGSDDPITPPAYAERVASSLTNALHIVNQDQSHMQAALGCMPTIMANFISAGTLADLPIDCLQRLRAPAFFVDANGPLP